MLTTFTRNIIIHGIKQFANIKIINKSLIRTHLGDINLIDKVQSLLLINYQRKYFYNMSTEIKPQIVFVLGGPGAGKGTQCQNIVNEFGFVHLSAGDLLREERARPNSEMGELIEDCIKNGKIVPVKVTCSLLENAIHKNMKELGKTKFLIDGFPRNQDNLDGWNLQMSEKVDFLFVLFFDCNEEICIERCLKRGKAGSGRSDDNEESMKKRIQTYTNDSLPIIEHYKNLKKVRHINASLAADEVFEEVQEAFRQCQLIKGAGDV